MKAMTTVDAGKIKGQPSSPGEKKSCRDAGQTVRMILQGPAPALKSSQLETERFASRRFTRFWGCDVAAPAGRDPEEGPGVKYHPDRKSCDKGSRDKFRRYDSGSSMPPGGYDQCSRWR